MLDSSFAQPLSKSSLVYLLVWHPPLRTPYISSPNHCLFFTTHCFAVVSRLCHLILECLLTLYLELFIFYFNACIHLTILISATEVTHFLFLQAMQHTTLHTTAVQCPSHYQWYILWYILICKQWYQLPEFIPSNSDSGLHMLLHQICMTICDFATSHNSVVVFVNIIKHYW